jgi:hypothetical protein
LDFLGFIRPNRDFSVVTHEKIKNFDSRLRLCAERLSRVFLCFAFRASGKAGLHPVNSKHIARLSVFCKPNGSKKSRVARLNNRNDRLALDGARTMANKRLSMKWSPCGRKKER